MKNYVHASKLGSRGGTYRTETWKALKTVLHAAQFGEGSATLADLNAELGVSTRLSAAARGEEGLIRVKGIQVTIDGGDACATVPLPLTQAQRKIVRASHDAIMRTNLSRFSSYH